MKMNALSYGESRRRIFVSQRKTITVACFIVSCVVVCLVVGNAFAVLAPGAPGATSVWASAQKEFLGTSATNDSRVYFTGAQGILTEVFYPTLDCVQNVDLQFLITDTGRTWGAEERRQKSHVVTMVDKRALIWQVVTVGDNGKWRITKKIFTDPAQNCVVQRTTFESLDSAKTISSYNLYILNNPTINNTGGGENAPQAAQDNSRTETKFKNQIMLVASEPGSTSSALALSVKWKVVKGQTMVSSGFVGKNDGYSDLFGGANDRTMDLTYDTADGGNVAQTGWINFPKKGGKKISFDVVLGFGKNDSEAVAAAYSTISSKLSSVEKAYVKGWKNYTKLLKKQGGKADDQYYLAAMTLKCSQDKSNGAMVAGMGVPWGESQTDNNQGGYHLVWARDLFKFASALVTAGDSISGNLAIDYLFNVQMQSTGRFPQNSKINGTPYWNATQMDEIAMPVILAWKLHRNDLWTKIKMAADYLAKNGPATEQDRWEEMKGFSPSTIAAEVAGLVCAADLARQANDTGAASYYLKRADKWRNNVADWTFTTTGFHKGDGQYYIRINDNQDPNDDVQLEFKNGAGRQGERYIVDGGFLELVRMGVMSPNDWTILASLPEYDSILKQTLPEKGDAWFRYNYDGYGENNDGAPFNGTGRGRLWPIFTAERGIYEIAKSGNGNAGLPYQQALKAFSSPAGFIPEQIWNISASITGWQTTTPPAFTVGAATGSMQPLNWAMGEYINIIAAISQGRHDAPFVVVQRYSTDQPQVNVTFKVNASTVTGENMYLVGDNPLLSSWEPQSGIKLSPKNYPVWSIKISLRASTAYQYKYVKMNDNGAVVWEAGQNKQFITPGSGDVERSDVFSQ